MTNPKPTITKSEALAWMNKAAKEARKESAAEIARLRGELSRAAVRQGEGKGVVEFARRCFDTPISRRRIDNEYATEARKVMADFLATPSPLSDAAQEVLEAAMAETVEEKESEIPEWIPLGRARLARRAAVDRYRALLEGRGREEE